MHIRILFFIAFLISFSGKAQDVAEVRSKYPLAKDNLAVTQKLNDELSKVADSNSILSAYRGAVLTLEAHFEKNKMEKLRLFKEGKRLIDNAIENNVSNIEMRMIRLGVQENAPKILGYHKEIEQDKEFILRNYQATTSNKEKQVVKKFAMQSNSFTEEDRAVFD